MPQKVLFVCTGNSARSIMAESMLNALGGGRFRGYSAGSHPSGRVHPLAIEVLERNGFSAHGARTKDWHEFLRAGAPPMNVVITVCDEAAGEACPLFPGRPLSAHWGVPDPARAEGTEEQRRAAFRDVLIILRRRVQQLTSLPFEIIGPRELSAHLRDIGQY